MENRSINTPRRLLSPKMDIIFKLLFGDKRNIDILIDFLKAVLNLDENEYESITIEDPQLKRENKEDKLGIVDVRIRTKSDKIVHIEMQVLEQDEMPERVTYYNSKLLVTQLKSGEDYDQLQKTISIVIADFDIVKNGEKYHNVFQLRERDKGIRFTDLIEINTLELHKIPENTDNTKKYEWLQFLTAEREEEFEMLAEKNPVIKKAYVELKRLSQDEEMQLLYEAREKAIRDENARIRTFYKRGVAEGREEGKSEGKKEIARNLLQRGMTLEQVSEITGLEIEAIQAIV